MLKKHLFAVSLLLLIGNTIKAQLAAGTYTVCPSGCDYTTLAVVLQELSDNGVSGHVIIQLASGTYSEDGQNYNGTGMDFWQIGGDAIALYKGSATQTVTIESMAGNADSVILTSTSGGYVIQFNDYMAGADFYIFKNLTFQSSQSGNVLRFDDACNYDKFINCKIIGGASTGVLINFNSTGAPISNTYNRFTGCTIQSSNTANYLISSTGNRNDHYLTFENNTFINGRGIYLASAIATPNRGLTIINNNFSGHSLNAITSYFGDSVCIKSNIIDGPGITIQNNPNYFYIDSNVIINGSVILNNCDSSFNIINNTITNGNIQVQNCDGSVNKYGLIVNNMVYGGNLASIHLTQSAYHKIYNNSLWATPSPLSQAALTIASNSKNISMLNNIFKSSGSSKEVIRVDNTSTVDTSDYNAFYQGASPSTLAYWGTTYYSSLAALSAATGQDQNSVYLDPQFISTSDLHISTDNVAFDALGTSVPGVVEDIEGDIRSVITPDIGADEFELTVVDIDASLLSIDSITGITCSDLTGNIYVTIKNFGQDTLKSAEINFMVNSVLQPVVNLSGLNLSYKAKISVNIGGYLDSFKLSQSHDIIAWVSNPNGVADTINNNDTTAPITNFYSAMQGGVYTIGPGGDYDSLNEVVVVMNQQGICGSVTLNVMDGIYNEQVSFNNIKNTSVENFIVLQSLLGDSTGVVYTHNGDATPGSNYTFRINGTDYITIKNMTIEATGVTNGVAISVDRGTDFKGATHVSIANNRIMATTSGIRYITGLADGYHYNEITNNYIQTNLRGIEAGAGAVRGKNLKIQNNQIYNTQTSGMDIWFFDSVEISNNTIVAGSNSGPGYIGLRITNSSGKIKVYNNKIAVTKGGSGFQASDCLLDSVLPAEIFNNIINVQHDSTLNTTCIGFNFREDIDYFKLMHNTILVKSTNANSTALKLASPVGDDIHHIVSMNNIFANFDSGYACFFGDNNRGALSASNYNNYYAHDSTFVFFGYNPYVVDSTDTLVINTLAELQFYIGIDNNSILADPLFRNRNTNLHICNSDLFHKGNFLGINTDYDERERNPDGPTVGAYEEGFYLGSDYSVCDTDSVQTLDLRDYNYLNDYALYSWELNNKFYMSPTIAVTKTGKYIGKALSTGCGVSFTDTIFITVDSCSSQDDTTSIFEIQPIHIMVYPNPANNFIDISLDKNILNNNAKLKIYDLLGKVVLQEKLVSDTFRMNISNLYKGMYLFSIENEELQKVVKLIIE